MTSFDVYDRLDEMGNKVDKVNALLIVIMEHYFNFRKADFNSSDKQEWANAHKLCSTYDKYTILLDVVCDIICDMKENIMLLQEELEEEKSR